MGYSKRITTILFAMLINITSLPSLAADDDGETSDFIVRVYFDDETTARRIAVTFEPLESRYERGYLILTLDLEDLVRLHGQASRLGIRIEPDSERMDQEIYYAELSKQGLRCLSEALCQKPLRRNLNDEQD